MRYGYTPELAQYLETSPPRARPILETVITSADDIRDTYDDFNGADSTSGLTLFPQGGVRLSGSGTNNLTTATGLVAGADITSLVPPLSAALDVALVEWDESTVNPDTEILTCQAYLDQDTGSGQQVTTWYAALYRLASITDEGGAQVWNITEIGRDSVAESLGSAGWVTFDFTGGASIPTIGDSAPIIERGAVIGTAATPITMMAVWALKGNGEVASNVAWQCDSGNSTVTNGGHDISRYTLTRLDERFATGAMQFIASGPSSGVPACAFRANTGYASASIEWTTNDLDLGASPSSGTDLELVLQGAIPSGTSIVGYINDGSGWVEFKDGDVIGQDNSADPFVSPDDEYANSGEDLSGVTRQQNYDLRVTLTTSADTSRTPRLFRVGVREVTRERVDGLVEFGESAWAVDPITCQSEVPQMTVLLHRDGARDYRSWAEDLFSTNHANDLLLRVWIGHPSLARRYWLHIDDFLVANYRPARDVIEVDCISPLHYTLATIPPKVTNSRDPILYDGSTIKDAYDDILTGQVGVSARFIGPGIEDDTTTVTKNINQLTAAIDVLRELTFLDGSALICSQGRLKVQKLFEDAPPEPGAFFAQSDIEVVAFDAGFDRRITQYDVPYGWASGEFAGEREHAASSTVIDNLGPTAIAQPDALEESVALWIEDTTHADVIGQRMVSQFVTGMAQIRFRSATPKPWLEPGDACAIEQDSYVGRDPRTGDAIRGRMWARALVTQCHDVLGTEFTAWVRSWVDVIPSTTAVTRSSKLGWKLMPGLGKNVGGTTQSSALLDTVLSVRQVHKDSTTRQVTGTTSETTLESFTLPANALGLNGVLRMTLYVQHGGSAGIKATRIRIAGTQVYIYQPGTTADTHIHEVIITNDGSASSQDTSSYVMKNSGGVGISGNSTTTIDTSVDTTVTITGECANSADSVSLYFSLAQLSGGT